MVGNLMFVTIQMLWNIIVMQCNSDVMHYEIRINFILIQQRDLNDKNKVTFFANINVKN